MSWYDEKVGWGVHERAEHVCNEKAEHVCKEAEYAGLKGGLINRVSKTQFPGGAMWKKCQIRHYENIETKSLKLNL